MTKKKSYRHYGTVCKRCNVCTKQAKANGVIEKGYINTTRMISRTPMQGKGNDRFYWQKEKCCECETVHESEVYPYLLNDMFSL